MKQDQFCGVTERLGTYFSPPITVSCFWCKLTHTQLLSENSNLLEAEQIMGEKGRDINQNHLWEIKLAWVVLLSAGTYRRVVKFNPKIREQVKLFSKSKDQVLVIMSGITGMT